MIAMDIKNITPDVYNSGYDMNNSVFDLFLVLSSYLLIVNIDVSINIKHMDVIMMRVNRKSSILYCLLLKKINRTTRM